MSNYKGTEYPKRPWSKEEMRKLIVEWPSKTPEELEVSFRRPYGMLSVLASIMRKNGIALEKKKGCGIMRGIDKMIQEVIAGK